MSELKTVGQSNYEGYRRESGGKSLVSGAEIPEWGELPEEIQEAWEAGANAVREADGISLDAVYRERAHLVAHLAAGYPSAFGLDTGEPDWRVVHVDLPTGQVSWHISVTDLDLFPWPLPDGAKWDGHDTAEKYYRLDRHTLALASRAEDADDAYRITDAGRAAADAQADRRASGEDDGEADNEEGTEHES
jgi:hypothetical protein